MGRLGNCIFEYASVMGMALTHGMEWRVVGGNEGNCVQKLKEVFVGIVGDEGQQCPPGGMRVREKAATKYNAWRDGEWRPPKWPSSGGGDITIVHSWLQSEMYFADSAPAVRKAFTFKAELSEYAAAVWDRNSDGTNARVGVHVRRTDMVAHYLGGLTELGNTKTPTHWLADALDYFRTKYRKSDVRFVVVSDDPAWALQQDFFRAADVHVHTNSDGSAPRDVIHNGHELSKAVQDEQFRDLAVLAHADHAILSTGTFGWWGAWLGPDARRGEVLYCPDSSELVVKDADLYPSRWTAASPEELKALVKAQQDTRSSKGKTQATANASTAADGAGAGGGRGQSLRKWLDSVNLGRLYNVLVHLGATDPSDLADMDEGDVRELKLRTLEQPRWERALRTLRGLAGREKLPAARQASSSYSTAGAVSAPKDTTRSGSSAVSVPSRPTTGKTQPAVPALPVPTDKPFLCVVTRVRCVRHSSLTSLL
jgi:galactoside 2-L-fucosyltransferase 1/2